MAGDTLVYKSKMGLQTVSNMQGSGSSNELLKECLKSYKLSDAVNEAVPDWRIEQLKKEDEKMLHEHQMWMKFRSCTSLSKKDAETKTWDTLEVTSPQLEDCAKTVRNWSPDFGIGLFIHGEAGNGKTHMIKALIQHNFSSAHTFRFINAPDLSDMFRDFENKEYHMQELRKPWGLVIDDFGTEKSSEYSQEQFFRLFESRKELGKVLLMTSNLNLKALAEKYNKRIVSRLGEYMAFVENNAPSHRRVLYKQNQDKLKALTIV